MKAIICTGYGAPEVLRLADRAKPEPKEHEICVAIKATAVNSADCRIRKADPFLVRLAFGLQKPRKEILGLVFSGVVESIGASATRFRAGDEVFGLTDTTMGCYAEYLCVPETIAAALKPANINHLEAASIPFGAHTALYFLKKANLRKGQHICIYGASGAVGAAAVQLAKHEGACVTAVCSAANAALVADLGADATIDYAANDITQSTDEYDIIFETVNKTSVPALARRVCAGGTLILGAGLLKEALQAAWTGLRTKKNIIMGTATATADDMNFLKELVEKGALKPVIDKTYRLEEMVEAHRYADTGRKKGNVAILVEATGEAR